MDTLDEEIRKLMIYVNSFDEAYPGQRNDVRRQEVVELAVRIADRIILAGSDGSEQETNFLTAKVAEAVISKVLLAVQHIMLREELMQRGNRTQRTN